jgi:hypothetical protein
MTSAPTAAPRPSHAQNLAAAASAEQVQMWKAAQTVRLHVSVEDGRDTLLDCLGLLDVAAPAEVDLR